MSLHPINTGFNVRRYRADWQTKYGVTKRMHWARQGLYEGDEPIAEYWQFPSIDVDYYPDGRGRYRWKMREDPPEFNIPRSGKPIPNWMHWGLKSRMKAASHYEPVSQFQPPAGFNWHDFDNYRNNARYPPHFKAFGLNYRTMKDQGGDSNWSQAPIPLVMPPAALVGSLAKDYVASQIKNPYVSALTKWQKRLPTTHSNLIRRNMTEMPDSEIPEGWTRQELIDAGVDGSNVIGRGPLFAFGKIGGKKIVLPGTGLFNHDPTIGLRGNIHDNLYNKKGRYLLSQKKTPLYLGDELVDPKAIDTLPIEKLDEILPKPWSQMSPSEKVRHTIMSKGLAIGRALGITQKHYSPGIYSPPEQQGSSMNLGQMPSVHNEGTGPDAIIPPTIPAANQAGGVRGGSGGGSVGFSEDFASRLRKARYGASQLLQTYTTDEEAIRTIEKYDDAAKQGKRARSMIESNLNGSQKRARQVLFKNPVANTMTEEDFNRLISV